MVCIFIDDNTVQAFYMPRLLPQVSVDLRKLSLSPFNDVMTYLKSDWSDARRRRCFQKLRAVVRKKAQLTATSTVVKLIFAQWRIKTGIF